MCCSIYDKIRTKYFCRSVYQEYNDITFFDFISSYNSMYKFSCIFYPVSEHVDHYDEGLENKTMALNWLIHHHVVRSIYFQVLIMYLQYLIGVKGKILNGRFYVHHVNYLCNENNLSHLHSGCNFQQTTLNEVFRIISIFKNHYNQWMGNIGAVWV